MRGLRQRRRRKRLCNDVAEAALAVSEYPIIQGNNEDCKRFFTAPFSLLSEQLQKCVKI